MTKARARRKSKIARKSAVKKKALPALKTIRIPAPKMQGGILKIEKEFSENYAPSAGGHRNLAPRDYAYDAGDSGYGGPSGTITKKKFFKVQYEFDYRLPIELRAIYIDGLSSAPQQIASHQWLKDYSYYYVESQFSIMKKSKNMVPKVHFESTFISSGGEIPGHIVSYFPSTDYYNVGKVVKEVTVNGNLSIKVPELKVPILGFSLSDFGIPADVVTGYKEWSSKEVKKFEYNVSVPKVDASSNGNGYVSWTFYHNADTGKREPYKTITVIGIPGDVVNDAKNNGGKLSAELKLTVEDQAAKVQVPVKLSEHAIAKVPAN